MNLRPEIVLPPGFSLRIDYDPAWSPASLTITAFQDDTPVGRAHVGPHEIGQRLRLEVAPDDLGSAAGEAPREPRLRLTPRNSARAIEMDAIRPAALAAVELRPPDPVPDALSPPLQPAYAPEATDHTATEALRGIVRDAAPDAWTSDDLPARAPNAVVWLENGTGVVLPAPSGVRHTLRALTSRAMDLIRSPLDLRMLDQNDRLNWRASWRELLQPSGAADV